MALVVASKHLVIEDLENLKTTDVLIVYARRMELNPGQMQLLKDYWEAGK